MSEMLWAGELIQLHALIAPSSSSVLGWVVQYIDATLTAAICLIAWASHSTLPNC